MKPKEHVYPHIAIKPPPQKPRRRWLAWLRRKPEATTFQKFLMVHLVNSHPRSALK